MKKKLLIPAVILSSLAVFFVTAQAANVMQAYQMVVDAAMDVLGVPERTDLEEIHGRLNKHLNIPFRLHAGSPTANQLLYIGTNRVEQGDGAGLSSPPLDDLINLFPDTTIDYQAASGGTVSGGTVYVDGEAFQLPDCTVGEYARHVFVYQSGNNVVDSTFDSHPTDVSSLKNPGELFAKIEGIPIGYVDLECTDATVGEAKYKTAGSTTNIIENKVGSDFRIFRFGSGAGGGGDGAAVAFRVKSMSGATAIIKKSMLPLDDLRVLITGNPANEGSLADLEVDLSAIVASPDNSSYYGLYIDLDQLGDPVVLTDTKRKVVPVYETTDFVLRKDTYELNPARFIFISGFITPSTGNTWVGSSYYNAQNFIHTQLGGFYPYTETQEDVSITSAAADNTITHTDIGGQPDTIKIWFYDDSAPAGEKETPLESGGLILYSNDTETHINSSSISFGAGDKLIVRLFRFTRQSNGLITATRSFKTPWYENTSTTIVPHSLGDKLEVVGLVLQEWDVTADKMRNLDSREIVENWNDTYIYLDWTGKTPSSTLRYRLVTGPSQLPYARDVIGNVFTFTDGTTLTDTTTSFPCTKIYHDYPVKISAVQKLSGKGWTNVDNIGQLIWVTDDANRYLQGDLDDLDPSLSEPVIIIIE